LLITELQEVESIFSSVQTACKTISNLVRRSALKGITGLEESGSINIQGEEQKKLDVITNNVLKAALQYTGNSSHCDQRAALHGIAQWLTTTAALTVSDTADRTLCSHCVVLAKATQAVLPFACGSSSISQSHITDYAVLLQASLLH
jgi:Fructose-1-6-bisphosphatase, N-terminal domain